jgi:hypothetical protein
MREHKARVRGIKVDHQTAVLAAQDLRAHWYADQAIGAVGSTAIFGATWTPVAGLMQLLVPQVHERSELGVDGDDHIAAATTIAAVGAAARLMFGAQE